MEVTLWSLNSKLLQMILLNIKLIFIYQYIGIWLNNLEDWRWKHTNTEIYWTKYWIWHYFRIIQQTLREMFSDGVMAENLVCDWVLLSSQIFKRWVNTILDITSFYWFYIDIPKEPERIFYSSLSSFGGGSTIINLKSSNNSPYSQLFLPLSLKSMLGWFFGNTPLLILDLVIVYLCCFNPRLIFICLIWYKLSHDISILMSWFNSIK